MFGLQVRRVLSAQEAPALTHRARETDTDPRARRRKCEVPSAGGQCVYCAAQNLACSRAGSIIQPKAAPVTPTAIISSPMPAPPPVLREIPTTGMPDLIPPTPRGIAPQAAVQDKALCFELVELYFKYIHDQLHSLFHRPSFMLDLHEGTAPLVLVYGMMAMSARCACPGRLRLGT